MACKLPNVCLAMVDSVSGPLAQLAFDRSYIQVEFGGFTRAEAFSMQEAENWMWYGAFHPGGDFTHYLFIQYDGWVLDGSLWQDSWLEYDYIGAPWPWMPNGTFVGNGGFSLRSLRLMEFLAKNRHRFPVATPEDAMLCQGYRRELERCGFKWAPLEVAQAFSFERELLRPTFGFHGIFNVPKVLSPDEWLEWKSLANDYVRGKVEWREVA